MRILAANDVMTQDALGVLGLAYRALPELPGEVGAEDLEQELVFAGLIGMIDPPRLEVPPALEKARHAGIRTVMITGDYPNTARAIAESIGLLGPGHQVSKLIDLVSSGRHHQVKVDEISRLRLIAWVDAMCPYMGDEEVRGLPDPVFQGVDWLAVRPKSQTAPRITRPGPLN